MNEGILTRLTDLVSQMERSVSVKTVMGEPMEFDDKVIIPFVKVSFGAGGGSGGGGGKPEGTAVQSGGMGIGVGGTAEPVALLVVFRGVSGKDGIRLFELKPKGVLGDLAEVLPRILDMIGGKATPKASEKQSEEKKTLMEI